MSDSRSRWIGIAVVTLLAAAALLPLACSTTVPDEPSLQLGPTPSMPPDTRPVPSPTPESPSPSRPQPTRCLGVEEWHPGGGESIDIPSLSDLHLVSFPVELPAYLPDGVIFQQAFHTRYADGSSDLSISWRSDESVDGPRTRVKVIYNRSRLPIVRYLKTRLVNACGLTETTVRDHPGYTFWQPESGTAVLIWQEDDLKVSIWLNGSDARPSEDDPHSLDAVLFQIAESMRPAETAKEHATETPPPSPTPAGPARLLFYSASPSPADPAGTVTLTWTVEGASSVSIGWVDKDGENVSRSGLATKANLTIPLSGVKFSGGDQVSFTLVANGPDGQVALDEHGRPVTQRLSIRLETDLSILAFTVTPDPVERGGTVTLTWQAPGGANVGIIRLSPENFFLPTEVFDLPESGSVQLQVPAEYVTKVTYYLAARDKNGVTRGAYATAGIVCPYQDHMSPQCPLTHGDARAAYQRFERGRMIWRGDTSEIYVLLDDGTYEKYEDTWNESESFDVTEEPPPGRFAPVRGFGRVYWSRPELIERLGWATAQESGYTMVVETVRQSLGRYPCTGVYLTLPDKAVVHLSCSFSTWEIVSRRSQ